MIVLVYESSSGHVLYGKIGLFWITLPIISTGKAFPPMGGQGDFQDTATRVERHSVPCSRTHQPSETYLKLGG